MNEPWTTRQISSIEGARHIWTDCHAMALPLVTPWLTLSLFGVLAGLGWRLTPGAKAPELYELLSACGAVLWLLGWPMAQSLGAVVGRTTAHMLRSPSIGSNLLYNGITLLALTVLMALSPCGLLAAYSPQVVLEEISTQDPALVKVWLGSEFLLALAIGGSCVILLSTSIALVTTRLTRIFASQAWLAVGLLLNLSSFGGMVALRPVWAVKNLGAWTMWAMSILSAQDNPYNYLKDLLDATVGVSLMAVVLLLMATVALSYFARNRSADGPTASLPLAAWASVAATAAYASGQLWLYSVEPGLRWPGNWQAIFALGLGVVWAVVWFTGDRTETLQRTNLVWPVIAVCGWVSATLPCVSAGACTKGQVGMMALLCLAVLYLGLVLIFRESADRKGTISRLVVLAVLALILLPLHPGYSGLTPLSQWAGSPQLWPITAGSLLLLLLAFAPIVLRAAPRRLRARSS